MRGRLPVLAVTGLQAEARIAAAPGVVTLSGGGDAERLASILDEALARGARAVISFGIAGGLRPGLEAGTTIIARLIGHGANRFDADIAWIHRLAAALPHAVLADLAGVDDAVCSVDGKTALHRSTGAAAVDMESHVAARLAARYGVPFSALRIIADPADRTIPAAAMVGMRPDGSTDVLAVIKALGRKPSELPGLLRTAFDARAAFASLKRDRHSLSSVFCLDEPNMEPAQIRSPGLPLSMGLDGFSGPDAGESHLEFCDAVALKRRRDSTRLRCATALGDGFGRLRDLLGGVGRPSVRQCSTS